MLENKLCVTQLRIRPPSHLQHRVTSYFSPGNVPDPLPRPSCHQIYNMFYPSDPSAVRLEPLLQEKFRYVAPMKVARYEKFPLGDGQSVHVGKNLYSF